MVARTRAEIEKIWVNVDGLKRLSDRVVGIGPFGIGLDAMLTFIPIVSPLYSAGAGLWLMTQGVRARAPAGTLARMAAYLIADTATDAVPIAGSVVDIILPGHLMAAKALQKHIESTHWIEGTSADARASGAHEQHVAHVRATKGLRKVVYLHD